jgi:hypothetical protein
MKTKIRALGILCIISMGSLATTSALARGGHFGGHHGGHGGFRVGGLVAGVVLAPLVISSMLYPPVYYGPTYYPQPYYPPVYDTYPYQTYPLQGAAPRADSYVPQQSAAVGPPVPAAGSAPNFTGAGQSGASWYYCAESKNYFPYVRECASLWRPEPVQVQR